MTYLKRTGKYLLTVFMGCLLIIAGRSLLAQPSAEEIVRKSIELLRSTSSYSEMSMTIVKPDWSREIRLKSWALEPDFALILITHPARDKGTVTLKRQREVWNYIPSVQKTIKVPPSMMGQSWMGSDFTNDDLVRQSSMVEDYQHRIAAEEDYQGYPCYKIEMIPRPEAGVVWGKIYLWITREGYMQLRVDYYDEDEYLVQKMVGSNIKVLGGKKLPTRWEMFPQDDPGSKTIMQYHTIDFNKKIAPRFFSQQNMKRVR